MTILPDFVRIEDAGQTHEALAEGILNDGIPMSSDSFFHIVNSFLPQSVNVLDLARIVAESLRHLSGQALNPQIEVVDEGLASLFTIEDKERVHGDVQKSKELLHVAPTTSVRESIDKIVRARLSHA